jgi:hypothetical protein
VNPCRMGAHCRGRSAAQEPAESTSRGLCLACERHGRYAIGHLPHVYVDLAVQLGVSYPGQGGSGVRVVRIDPPVPLRLEIEAMMAKIKSTLEIWEWDVRYRAQLSTVPQKNVRAGHVVQRAATTLVTHYSVLLALRLPASALDGVDGVVTLTGLHHRASSLAGKTELWEWRELPCPGEPVSNGCGAYKLGQWIGSNKIECDNCRWWCTIDEYRVYATTFSPPRR